MDDGFSYLVPDTLSGVEVGAVVRVPLGGRTVRGYVVDVRSATDTARLKQVKAVSGDVPVFTQRLLDTLRWAALHYVAPVATLLAKPAPPNLTRITAPAGLPSASRDNGQLPATNQLPEPYQSREPSPLPEVSTAAADGKRHPSQYLVGAGPWASELAGLVGAVVEAGRSSLVVAPTRDEASRIHAGLSDRFGSRALFATSSLPARELTSTWVAACTTPGSILVGTREIAFWPVAGLALAVIVEEGRRAMKAPQTPTVDAYQLLRRRASVERFSLVLAGPVPTLDALAVGVKVVERPGRVWGLVEVVDRSDEPPGSGLLSERAKTAIRSTSGRGGRTFVLVHRRDYAPAYRCVRCREIRRCQVCGSAGARAGECSRCGQGLGSCVECGGDRFEPLGAGVGRVVAALARFLGEGVGIAGSSEPVAVGTERDLVGLREIDLAVAIDADGLILAPNYRAEEDALRLLARLATKVSKGRSNRCLIQTSQPEHEVIQTLRSGHPMELLQAMMERRERDGFPPAAELVAISLKGTEGSEDEELRSAFADRAEVLGPATAGESHRWLVQGSDLRSARVRLRRLAQQWRDAGVTVRIDADPIDL